MIPPRQPIVDLFQGVALQHDEILLLAESSHTSGELRLKGEIHIRYGIQFLGKPHLALVPGLIALDYGEMLTGEAAWDFLLRRSNLYPRSDVIGYRSDGVDDMIPVKLLDPVAPVQVLVYSDAAATNPLGRAGALISSGTADIPPRLLEYLPVYKSIEDWQKASAHG